jgi:AcrR family transcriptional regulator
MIPVTTRGGEKADRPSPATPRRTQADRSAATRGALADATIELLIARGWASLTVAEVCSRAGVSTGAFHHHYASLPSLLADALRRLYHQMFPTARPPVTDLAGLVELSWDAIGNPRFEAVLEAWLAMANDPSLREEIGPVVAEFAALVTPAADDRWSVLPTDDHRAFYLTAREAMLGLALGRATNGGRPLGHETQVLEWLSTQARVLDERSEGTDAAPV